MKGMTGVTHLDYRVRLTMFDRLGPSGHMARQLQVERLTMRQEYLAVPSVGEYDSSVIMNRTLVSMQRALGSRSPRERFHGYSSVDLHRLHLLDIC